MTARKLASVLDANSKKIINLPAPTNGSTEPARKIDLETAYNFLIQRGNHTGTINAATDIAGLAAAVQSGVPINTLAPANGSIGANAQKIVNLAAPTANTDAATKQYVDTAVAGLASGQTLKGAVKALVRSGNVNTASPGATLDGVTAATGDVFWLGAQTTASQNGPWVWNGAAAAMTRPTNFNSTTPNTYVGAYWIVTEGTSADTILLLTNDTFTLNTTAAPYKVIDIAAAAAVAYETDLGDGSATTFTVTHNFGTKAVSVNVFRNASPFDEVDVFIGRPTVNTVTVEPDETWSTNQFHVVVSKL